VRTTVEQTAGKLRVYAGISKVYTVWEADAILPLSISADSLSVDYGIDEN
jgi:hypothetical protein